MEIIHITPNQTMRFAKYLIDDDYLDDTEQALKQQLLKELAKLGYTYRPDLNNFMKGV